MNDDNCIVNNDERVVTVREIVDGEESIFYAIRDVYLGYWRSDEPLDDDKAWTQDRRLRAEFENHSDAIEELMEIWRVRRGSPARFAQHTELETAAA
jgi:hypothetical protein